MTVGAVGGMTPCLMATHTLSVEGSLEAGLAHFLWLRVAVPAGRELSLWAIVVAVLATTIHAAHVRMDLMIEPHRFVQVTMTSE